MCKFFKIAVLNFCESESILMEKEGKSKEQRVIIARIVDKHCLKTAGTLGTVDMA